METLENVTSKNKAVVEAFDRAFAKGDVDAILSQMADDVEWEMVGDMKVAGKENIRKFFKSMEGMGLPEIWPGIKVAEGDRVTSEGKMKGHDREGKEFTAAYCDSFLFKSGKIKQLTSYVITFKDGFK
jgi:uncharacterized protein